MARHLLSRNCVSRFTQGYHNSSQRPSKHNCCGCTDVSNRDVIHDRQNQRFTITLDCDGAVSSAVLKYTISHNQVELMSTEVPQSHRGKGVAAHLAKAALDFVIEENLKARISCWYIRKYVDENPHLRYQDHIEDK